MKKLRLLVILSLGFLLTAGAQEIPSYPFKNADNAEGWRLDSIHYYDFDGMITDSLFVWRDLYTINEYGNKDSLISYFTDGGSTWMMYSNQGFRYDELQNEISHTFYTWNGVAWEIMNQTLKHYHPGDTLIESMASAVFDEGVLWKKQDSIYYSRDELNRIDSTFEFFWTSSGNYYEPRRINCKVYNANNLVQFDTIYTYNNDNWQFLYARQMSYNAAGNIIEGFEMKWDENLQFWKNESRILWSYDASQKLRFIEVYQWDETSTDWVYEYYHIYTYDNNGNLDLFMHLEWNEDLQIFEKNGTFDHFWGFHNFIGLQDLQFSQALKVFPNPAREHVNVYVEEDCELVMLNMSGQQVLSTCLTKGNNNIKLSAYPAGTYLLRTNGSREMASFKLMLR